jgi:hypothetical protein
VAGREKKESKPAAALLPAVRVRSGSLGHAPPSIRLMPKSSAGSDALQQQGADKDQPASKRQRSDYDAAANAGAEAGAGAGSGDVGGQTTLQGLLGAYSSDDSPDDEGPQGERLLVSKADSQAPVNCSKLVGALPNAKALLADMAAPAHSSGQDAGRDVTIVDVSDDEDSDT